MTDRGTATSPECYDHDSVTDLATRLLQRRATLPPPPSPAGRVIAIDGPAGSGKTTLAAALERHLATRDTTVAVMHMDDLYHGWDGLDPELEGRVLAQVLVPLARHGRARWQRYDWHAERFAEWVDLDRPEVLVLEGCGSGAVRYAPYTTLLVWVEAGRRERVRRGVARDGTAMLPHWRAWMRREADYFAAHRTAERADVHLSTG